MTDKNNTKWSYIFRSSMRDFVLMAMITISLVSILVVTNISNEQNEYIIKLEQREQKQEDQEDKETSQARASITIQLAELERDLNITRQILDRLILFEEQIHNENIIKFQKLDKLQSDDEIKFQKLDNMTSFMTEKSASLEGKLDDIILQLQKNIDGSLDIINQKIDTLANTTK